MMKVFVTGANGFIGLPTVGELVKKGHHVLALTRSDEGAKRIHSTHPSSQDQITVVRGSIADHNLMTEKASESDAVIHLAYNHDFVGTDRITAAKQDDDVLDALIAGLRRNGSEKPLIVAGGCGGLRPAKLAKPGHSTFEPLREDDDFEKGSARVHSNEKVVHAEGIRGIVMRLPPTVHGKGDPNFVHFVRDMIDKNRRAVYLSEGTNRWPATHIKDTAVAFMLALEKGQRGYLHPIAEEGVAFKDIVAALGARIGVKAESVGEEEFRQQYGWIADTLSPDRPTNGEKTQRILGWTPKEIGLIQDIAETY